jgi:hypothetical protein
MNPSVPKIFFTAAAPAALVFDAASAGELHRGRCSMDICSWYSLEGKDVAASNPEATLFKVTLQTWTSKHRGGAYDKKAPRVGGDVVSVYYSCSKTKPALVEAADGKWTATFLNLNSPPGYQESAVMQYFIVCHGFDAEKSRSGFAAVARRLGYRKVLDTPDAVELSKPEQILTR